VKKKTETVSVADAETVPAVTGVAPSGFPSGTIPKAVAGVNEILPTGVFMTTDHKYYMNGEGPVPSVTTVLGIMDKPAVVAWKAKEVAKVAIRNPKMIREIENEEGEDAAIRWMVRESDKARDSAARLGTGIHLLADMVSRASESLSKGFEIGEHEKPYLNAFEDFLERYSASSIVSSEKAVWSLNGYAGTYDLLMLIDSELWLVDIKTSKGYYPEYGLQLAGYRWADSIVLPNDPKMYPMPEVHRTGILHLRPDQYPDTGWRLVEYPTDYKDYIVFLGLLEAWKWKQEGRFTKAALGKGSSGPILITEAVEEGASI
jgi:hypothetical protein